MGQEIELDMFGDFPEVICECCRPRYATYTSTTLHKWTREEIAERIVELSADLVEARWYNRGPIREQLRHWHQKLSRYDSASEEFVFNTKQQ